ncbi:MAG: G1 family glutamic endopeptidase, partial [Thermoguttaceae bacterium]
ANVTFDNQGQASFSLLFTTTGTPTLTLTDNTTSSLTGSITVTVTAAPSPTPLPTPAAATHLVLMLPPDVPSGLPVKVMALAEDANNQPVPSYAGTATLSIANGSATLNGAALPANVTFNQGNAPFSLVFAGVGTTPTLTLTDTATTSPLTAVSVPVTVVQPPPGPPTPAPGVATHLALLLPPIVPSGVPVLVQAVAEDVNNQPVPGYAGKAMLSITGGTATLNGTPLPANVAFNNQGPTSFSLVFTSVGTPTLTLTDAAPTNPLAAASVQVTVTAAPSPTPPPTPGGTTPPSQAQSSNWSGYAALAKPGSVTAVSGSWNVPAVTGGSNTTAYSAVWVGMDGATASSPSVEQIGTGSDIVAGQTHYYVWYEMYPQQAMNLVSSLTVAAGDAITASVQYVSGQFQLSITDTTQSNESFAVSFAAPLAQRSSAEWIVEAPSSATGILPLADFNSVTFSNATATINGITGPIDSASWFAVQINMVLGNTVQAATTTLTDSAGASSFAVNYLPAGSTGSGSGSNGSQKSAATQSKLLLSAALPHKEQLRSVSRKENTLKAKDQWFAVFDALRV